MDEALDLLMMTGFRKPVSHLTISDCFDLSAALLDYHLMAKVKAEMDQFCEGLKTLDFLNAMRATPTIWEPYFSQIETNLTPRTYARSTYISISVLLCSMHIRRIIHFLESIKELVVVNFSQKGSVLRPLEEQAYIYFTDFLDECVGEFMKRTKCRVFWYFSITWLQGFLFHTYTDEDINCRLEDVMVFFSASDRIHPLGFKVTPSIVFLHGNAKLPTSSTCALELRLPTIHTCYEDFKEAMILGVRGHDGFGGV